MDSAAWPAGCRRAATYDRTRAAHDPGTSIAVRLPAMPTDRKPIMPTVLLQGFIAPDHADTLRAKLPQDWEVLVWDSRTDDRAAFAPLAARADAIVGGNIPGRTWPETPRLKIFQIPWTGYNFTTPAQMPAGVPVCNCFEHETTIAEYIMLGILEWQIGMRHMDARFRAHGWDGKMPGNGPRHGEALGKTIGIVGYGHIGEELAVRAAAFGMNVIGIRRRQQPTPSPLQWLGTAERLDDLLAASDFVVIACDLNDETRHLINAERLARMQAHAVLINVARGEVVEETALYEALRDKRIGGAIIDTWYNYNAIGKPEVWPCNEDFQKLDNTILTPHCSALTDEQVARRWQFVAANIQRAVAGEPVLNQVMTGTAEPGIPW